MTAVTADEKAAVANIGPRFACISCSQCGKDLGPGDSGVSDCREHGAGLLEFTSSWAGHTVLAAYSNDEDDGIQIWRVKLGGVWISVTPDNFMQSQIDVWAAEAGVHFDGMTNRLNTEYRIAQREAA